MFGDSKQIENLKGQKAVLLDFINRLSNTLEGQCSILETLEVMVKEYKLEDKIDPKDIQKSIQAIQGMTSSAKQILIMEGVKPL